MAHRNTFDLSREETSPFAQAQAISTQTTLGMVQHAVDNNQALLAFQPIVQSPSPQNVAFYEGLIRIQDDTGRIIPAKDFITQVEERELGRQIDCLALEMGLRTLMRVSDIRLSINMSARSIGYGKWLDILGRALKQSPHVGERLILEITESSAMTVPELVVNFMRDLHKRGINFALDDFGAGHTSFRYLKEFQFDILKIDAQFIRNVATDTDNQVLTQALISIAEHFEMYTVAEAVETKQASDWLSAAGVSFQQGYYFAAPSISPPWSVQSATNAAL